MTTRKYYSNEAKNAAMREKAALGLSGLIAGIGIGGAIALLFAPDEGDAMRHRLMEAMEDGTEKGKEKLESLIKSVEAEYPDFRDRIMQAVESMKNQVDNR